MANKTNTTVYVGVTSDLQRRVYEHKNKLKGVFTSKYNINKLVYYEETSDVKSAIEREKQLKNLSREKKDNLIHSQNLYWQDLSAGWYE